MSAQRSRIRQKLYFEKIENMNYFLKTENNNLIAENQNIIHQNDLLKKEIEILKLQVKDFIFKEKNRIEQNCCNGKVLNGFNGGDQLEGDGVKNAVRRGNSKFCMKSKIGQNNFLLFCFMVIALVSNFNEHNISHSTYSSSSTSQSNPNQLLNIPGSMSKFFKISNPVKGTNSSSSLRSSIIKKNGLVPLITTSFPFQKNKDKTLYELCSRYAKLNINQSCKCKPSEQVLKLPKSSKRNSSMSSYSLQNQFLNRTKSNNNNHKSNKSNTHLDIFSKKENLNLFFKNKSGTDFNTSMQNHVPFSNTNLIRQNFKHKIHSIKKINKLRQNKSDQLFVCKVKRSEFAHSALKFDLVLDNDNYQKLKNTSSHAPLYFHF